MEEHMLRSFENRILSELRFEAFDVVFICLQAQQRGL
jgi:hypothetical protein